MPESQELLQTRTQTYSGKVILTAEGDLDVYSAPSLQNALSGAVAEAAAMDGADAELVVDVRAVPFIDSAGIGVLIGGRQAAGENYTVVFSPGTQVARALQTIRIQNYLRVVPAGPAVDLSSSRRSEAFEPEVRES